MTKQDQFLIDQLQVYKNLRHPGQPTLSDITAITNAFRSVFGYGDDSSSVEVPWFKIAKENSAPLKDYSPTGDKKTYPEKVRSVSEVVGALFGTPDEMDLHEKRVREKYTKKSEPVPREVLVEKARTAQCKATEFARQKVNVVVETPVCKCKRAPHTRRPSSEVQADANLLCAYFHGCKKGFSFSDARRVLKRNISHSQFSAVIRKPECEANGKKFLIKSTGGKTIYTRYQVVEIHKS